MCGRVELTSTIDELSSIFNAKFSIEDASKYRTGVDVRPTQHLCVINSDEGQRIGKVMRWGLVPPYIKNLSDMKFSTFNARAEGILTNRTYKGPFKSKRCIVVVNGFYEWKDEGGKKKQRYYFTPSEGNVFGMAGLWERTTLVNSDGSSEEMESCTIITTEPNEFMSEFHNRMPVILMPSDYDKWLSQDTTEKELVSLMKACPPDLIIATKVRSDIRTAADLSLPLEDESLAF